MSNSFIDNTFSALDLILSGDNRYRCYGKKQYTVTFSSIDNVEMEGLSEIRSKTREHVCSSRISFYSKHRKNKSRSFNIYKNGNKNLWKRYKYLIYFPVSDEVYLRKRFKLERTVSAFITNVLSVFIQKEDFHNWNLILDHNLIDLI